MAVALSARSKLKLVERKGNGGIVCEFPILCVGELDLSLAAGGKGKLAVTREMLDEIVANSKDWPGPLPLNVVPHREWQETAGPAPGFIDELTRRGDDLWARCSLGPWLAASVLADEWRGFSVDMKKSPRHASRAMNGWCVLGGVFTNRPAADVHFSVDVAASAESSAELALVVSLSLITEREGSGGGRPMKTAEELALEVTQLQKEAKEKDEQIAALSSKVEKLEADVVKANSLAAEKASLSGRFETDMTSLQGQLRTAQNEVTALTTKNTALEADVRAKATEIEGLKAAALQGDIRRAVKDGLDRGIPASVFEGTDRDPVAMLQAKFGGSLASLQALVSSYPAPKKRQPVPSGVETDDDGTAALSAEDQAELRRHGLDPKYASVNSPDDLATLKK